MSNLLEKTLNFGLGLALYSKEKIEAMVDEMVEKGEVAKKDAREFAKNLVQKGEEQRTEFKKLVHDEIESVLDKMNIAQKKDLLSREDIARIVAEEVTAALKLHQAGNTAAADATPPPVPPTDETAATQSTDY